MGNLSRNIVVAAAPGAGGGGGVKSMFRKEGCVKLFRELGLLGSDLS